MKRREFIAGLGSAAAWPVVARAQQAAACGGRSSSQCDSPRPSDNYVAAFAGGFAETGYVEGTNVAIEYRWANDRPDQLAALATDMVHRGVAVITARPTHRRLSPQEGALATIPVVFSD